MNAHDPSIHVTFLVAPRLLHGYIMKWDNNPLEVRLVLFFTYLKKRILQNESYDCKKNYNLDLISQLREGTFLANVIHFPSYASSLCHIGNL